ncbi:hypothetical protein D3C85_1267570 [compost metagenome]
MRHEQQATAVDWIQPLSLHHMIASFCQCAKNRGYVTPGGCGVGGTQLTKLSDAPIDAIKQPCDPKACFVIDEQRLITVHHCCQLLTKSPRANTLAQPTQNIGALHLVIPINTIFQSLLFCGDKHG